MPEVNYWQYLWSHDVPKKERKGQEQYQHSVTCHGLACVLVDLHVYEVSCIGRAYFDHA